MVFNIYNPDGSKAFSIESTDCIEENLSLESSMHEIEESNISIESSYAECAKYMDTVEVLSTEGFGDAIKTGVSKAVEKIKGWLVKLKNWLMKIFKEIKYRITKFILSIKLRIQAKKLEKQVIQNTIDFVNEIYADIGDLSFDSYSMSTEASNEDKFSEFKEYVNANFTKQTFLQVMYLVCLGDISKNELTAYVKLLIDAKNDIYAIRQSKDVDELVNKMTQVQTKYGSMIDDANANDNPIEEFFKLIDNKESVGFSGRIFMDAYKDLKTRSDIVDDLVSSVTDKTIFESLQNTITEYNNFIDNATMLASSHETTDERLLMQKVKALREFRPIIAEISRFCEFAQKCIVNYQSVLYQLQKMAVLIERWNSNVSMRYGNKGTDLLL